MHFTGHTQWCAEGAYSSLQQNVSTATFEFYQSLKELPPDLVTVLLKEDLQLIKQVFVAGTAHEIERLTFHFDMEAWRTYFAHLYFSFTPHSQALIMNEELVFGLTNSSFGQTLFRMATATYWQKDGGRLQSALYRSSVSSWKPKGWQNCDCDVDEGQSSHEITTFSELTADYPRAMQLPGFSSQSSAKLLEPEASSSMPEPQSLQGPLRAYQPSPIINGALLTSPTLKIRQFIEHLNNLSPKLVSAIGHYNETDKKQANLKGKQLHDLEITEFNSARDLKLDQSTEERMLHSLAEDLVPEHLELILREMLVDEVL